MKAFVFAVLAVVLFPGVGEAQVCRTGKPCGNTCIARNLTCRVGPGTAVQGNPSAPSSARPSTTGVISVPTGAQFVASSRGRVYYHVGCSAWRGLSPSNLRWFSSHEEAAAAGYTPST